MLVAQMEALRITRYLEVKTVVPEWADLAFVFGTRHHEPAYSAVDLVVRGIVHRVVLTGGRNRLTGEDEASSHLQILLSNGVQRGHIIVERESTNTLENVVLALPQVASTIDPKDIRAIVVITKWYHCRRAMMTLKRHLPAGVRYYAEGYEPTGVTRSDWWLSDEGCKRVLKEWRNIPRYLRRGDIAEMAEGTGAYV